MYDMYYIYITYIYIIYMYLMGFEEITDRLGSLKMVSVDTETRRSGK